MEYDHKQQQQSRLSYGSLNLNQTNGALSRISSASTVEFDQVEIEKEVEIEAAVITEFLDADESKAFFYYQPLKEDINDLQTTPTQSSRISTNVQSKSGGTYNGNNKKFARIFSNPAISSMQMASSSTSFQRVGNASSYSDKAIKRENVRSVTYHPHLEKEGHNHQEIPTNYMDPRGKFPAKDAYISNLKSQFFSLGFSFGSAFQMFVVSLLLMVISTSENAGPIRELSYEYYAVFRGVFLISYFFLLYGACLFIWRRVRVDYPAVLRVSYAHTYQYILRGSSSIAYIVFACFIAYVITLTGGFDDLADRNVLKHLWPALAFFLPVVLFLCPIDTLTEPVFGVKIHGFSQRADLLSELFAVLRSPFSSPSFHRCFIADILCSLPKIYPDLQYTLCIYATGRFWEPERADWQFDKHAHAYDSCGGGSSVYAAAQILLALLPFHIRLWQCLRAYYEHGFTRHIFNALKYLLTILLTALSLARNSSTAEWNAFYGRAWLHFGVIATIYSFFWDVIMDWGLGSFRSRIFLLRDELHFRPSVYYAAVFIDFLARLGWALVISPQQPYLQQHFILLLAALEISRRCMWAVFRVEWEYVKNMRSSSTLRSGAVVAQSQAAQMSEKLYSVPQTDDSTDKLPDLEDVSDKRQSIEAFGRSS